MKNGMIFAGIGFELMGVVFGSYYVGNIIDQKLQTNGLAMTAFILLGTAGWFIHLLFLLKRFSPPPSRPDIHDKKNDTNP